jgi:RNA polymerase sigma-70 factor (ECF subfamily)
MRVAVSSAGQSSGEAFEALRPLMFSIAYRMLGTVGDAEDVVQEAFLRYHQTVASGTAVESPKAFLSSVTTRLAIDQLRSARVRRETYVGEWLPEPLVTAVGGISPAPAPDPADHAQVADSLSMAFLLLLERLSPLERAVFLLHEVFAYSYEEIADVVGRSPAACRQLGSRARRNVAAERPRFEASPERREELADRLLAAMDGGDLDGLVSLLSEDVVLYGDGGGVPPSWPKPIVGAEPVARLLLATWSQLEAVGARAERVDVNGQPGVAIRDADGGLVSVLGFDLVDGQVATIRGVISRGKLGHLAPLADVQALWRSAREKRLGCGGCADALSPCHHRRVERSSGRVECPVPERH